MRFAPVLAAFLLLASSIATAAPFQPADKLFTANFPAAPQKQEDTVPSQAGPAYKRVAYAVDAKSHMLMVGVIYVGEGPALPVEAQRALLNSTAQSMAKGMPGLVLAADGQSAVTMGSHSGRQIKGTANGAGFHARLFVTGKNLFMVQGLYDPRDPAAKAATEAFVGSFRIP